MVRWGVILHSLKIYPGPEIPPLEQVSDPNSQKYAAQIHKWELHKSKSKVVPSSDADNVWVITMTLNPGFDKDKDKIGSVTAVIDNFWKVSGVGGGRWWVVAWCLNVNLVICFGQNLDLGTLA